MGNGATLAGKLATEARVQIPDWGRWYADATVDGDHVLTGQVDLAIADLTLKGTILRGGPSNGRSRYRIVAGKGGWGKIIPRKAYGNDAGVKRSTVLADAALAAGEQIDLSAIAATDLLGAGWTREEGPAVKTLEQLVPKRWYVDEGGITRIGQRTAKPLPTGATRTSVELSRGKIVLASEQIASILPGVLVDGLIAADVQHEIAPETGLRSTVWGKTSFGGSRALSALFALFEQFDPFRKFRGTFEYRVATTEGKRLNLQPVRVSSGLPDLPRVKMRPGVAGCEAELALGAIVLVTFVDADPARPAVVAFEDAEGEGFEPESLTLMKGTLLQGVARVGDKVGPYTILTGSTKVRCG